MVDLYYNTIVIAIIVGIAIALIYIAMRAQRVTADSVRCTLDQLAFIEAQKLPSTVPVAFTIPAGTTLPFLGTITNPLNVSLDVSRDCLTQQFMINPCTANNLLS